MALVCLCRGNFYWPPHTTILFCSIFLDKIVLDTLKSRYHRSAPLGIAFLFVPSEARLIPIFGMFFYIRVLIAADGIVAPAAVHAGSRPHQLGVQQLHRRKVHITQGGHNIRKTVLDSKLRRRTRCKFIINRLVGFIRRNHHLVIVPFVAAAFRTNKRLVHQLPPCSPQISACGRSEESDFPPSLRFHGTK